MLHNYHNHTSNRRVEIFTLKMWKKIHLRLPLAGEIFAGLENQIIGKASGKENEKLTLNHN
ncbi:CLUMA_CG006749, isoform A [Clunio marinus]|uniref:CLUMA_CG006749, isoform A n=1 Tax=Clunio marinus TaxID=568069 RepID=A0A1J1HYV2_9DIPT|nr:CLUMA_CG006749, isoform A [Clunio marinus]